MDYKRSAPQAGYTTASPGNALSVSDTRRIPPGLTLSRRVPFYTYAGAALMIGAWIVSWARVSPWYFYSFFPLWVGFIFFLDGLTAARHGSSILIRSRKRFALLFLYSTPCWWVYELLNLPVQNWHYHGYEHYPWLFAFAHTTVDFSTVLPAVMEMAELLSTFSALRPRFTSPSAGMVAPRALAFTLVGLGGVALLLAVVFPRFAFPLVWVCMVLLLDPVNNVAGRKSALGHALAGDWPFLVVVSLAGLCCGFFWELWNWRALPYWSYTIPFFDRFPHLFAMPLPGYLGYLPFALELFAMYQVGLRIARQPYDGLAI